jgi:hypothetical protein
LPDGATHCLSTLYYLEINRKLVGKLLPCQLHQSWHLLFAMEKWKRVSPSLQLQVVAEDRHRAIFRGIYLGKYRFVVKFWRRERALPECMQVRTAELGTQQQSPKHVWAMPRRHTGLMIYILPVSFHVVRNWNIYSELPECCCWYCVYYSAVQYAVGQHSCAISIPRHCKMHELTRWVMLSTYLLHLVLLGCAVGAG